MTTTSVSVRTRATAAVVSLLLLIGVQVLGAVPKAMAASPATISGKVLDAVSGLPLESVVISAVGEQSVSTSSTGDYTLIVTAGDHVVTASLDGYAPKTSAQITVGDGATVAGINFTLQKYASVHGAVTDAAASGIGDVVVKLFDATTSDVNPVKELATVGSGTFVITDVVPGSYKVQYDASGVSYMTRWYNLASTRDQATIVTIAPGATLDLSQTLVKASSVSGKVVDVGGSGIPNADVTLIQNGAAVAQATTSAVGVYVIGSISGADQYTIVAQVSGYVTTWYGNVPSAANAVHFSLADSSNITLVDTVLHRGGSISGHMTPGNVDFSYVVASAPGVGSYSASVDTATGSYTIRDIPSGLYAVTFNANGYYSATIPDVSITGEQTETGIDATLVAAQPGSGYNCTVTGKVVNLAGQALPGVTVFSASTRFTTTAADGSYSLGVLSTDGTLNYGLDGYVRETRGSTCNGVGSTMVQDDVHLSRIVTIKGTVTEGGIPMGGASVKAYAAPSGGSAGTTTASDGTYTITNLPEGHYAVSASATGDPETFFGGGASLATASYYAMGEGSSTVNVNLDLYKAGSISGTVSMSNGTSTVGAQVTAWSADFSKTVLAGTDGTFTVGELPAGTFTLSAYLTKWASVSQQVIVHQGEAVSGTRLELGNGVAVSGIISRNNTPIPGLTVYLRTADGQLDTVTGGADGAYVFRGVPQGTYTVGATLGSDTYWLGGVTTPAHASTFTVSTDPVVNVDIKIPTGYAASVTVLLPGGTGPATGGSVDAYDSYGDHAGQGIVGVSGVATLSLPPGTYALKVSVDGYPMATGSVNVVDGPAIATVTLVAGAELMLTPDASSDGVSVAAVAREAATGVSVTGGDHLTGLAAGTYVVAYYPVGTNGSYCGPLAWYGGTSYVTATPVTLAEAESKTLTVHATCAPTTSSFTVTGTILPPAGVTLTVGSVSVAITDTAGSLVDILTTDAAGKFTFAGLPSGTYTITASDKNLVLVDATVQVEITTDDVAVTVPMVAGGSIIGRVLDSFGHQVPVIVNLLGGPSAQGLSTSTGQFTLTGLPAGDYTLNIVPAAPYTAVDLTPVHVTLGSATDVGTVTVQLGGRITGHLPSLNGDYSVTIDATDATGRLLASTTASSGTDYALWGVPAGTVYVRFSGAGLVTTWWQGAASLATATSVPVAPNGAVSGIDPTLAVVVVPTTTILGTVTGSDGPMAGVTVSAETSAGAAASATTAPDGTYVLTVPANAAYTVAARFCFGTQGELGCYGQYIQAASSVTVGTTPATHVDLVFGSVLVAFAQAPVPTISGTATVGQTLAATAGDWQPLPDAVSWAWFADSVAIPGSTGPNLLLTSDLVGMTITVQATAVKTGYVTQTTTSLSTGPVQPLAMTPGTVSIGATPTVDQPVSATLASWPVGATLTYQWSKNGVAISGATSTTYTPVGSDAGSTLTLTVTATGLGYPTVSASATTAVVLPGTIVAGTAVISGTAQVGTTLSLTSTGWTPSGVALGYQWLRDGATISGATTASYAPVLADVSHTLSGKVTGTKTGYVTATVTSAQTAAVAPAQQRTVVAGTVTISGTPLVSSTLTAQPGTWSPNNVRLSYQWLRDGVAIQGETGSTYTVALTDIGHRLSVSVTGARFGYVSATATSARTAVVAQPRVTAGTVTIAGTPTVGSRLTTQPGNWSPNTVRLAYQWLRDGVAVSGATRTGYTLTLADVGHVLSVSVTGTRFGYVPATAVSAPTAVVTQPRVVAGAVLLVGTPTVSSTLFAQAGGWDPNNVTLTYQWLRDGVPIQAANRRTYTVTRADVGHTLTVTVTGAAQGYLPTTVTSTRSVTARF